MNACFAVALRTLLKVRRRPVILAFSLVQPLFWIGLFAFLMQRFPLGQLPRDVDYVSYVLPGVCALSMMQGSSQSGIGLIRDYQRGFLQRILATPASRVAIHGGVLIAELLRMHLQAAVVLCLGVMLGARLTPEVWAIGWALVTSCLFITTFSSLSVVVALRTRTPEAMGAFVQMINMPLLFTSSALVPRQQMPGWLAQLADWNPLTILAEGLRGGLLFATPPAWTDVAFLCMFALTGVGLALHELARLGRDPA